MTRYLLLLLRIAMGLMFVWAAWLKLSKPWIVFATAVDNYNILPQWGVDVVARTLPWAELAIGLAMIAGVWQRWLARWSATAATLLLAGFFSLMLRTYLIGKEIDCGCFGSGDPISPRSLLRDGSLLACCAILAIAAWRKAEKKCGAPVEVAS